MQQPLAHISLCRIFIVSFKKLFVTIKNFDHIEKINLLEILLNLNFKVTPLFIMTMRVYFFLKVEIVKASLTSYKEGCTLIVKF